MQDQHRSSSTFNIAQWRDDVAQALRGCKPVNHLPLNSRSSRSRQHPTRPTLAETSANPQRYNLRCHFQGPPCYNYTRKRKYQMDDDEYTPPANNSGPPRRRGRPPNDPSKRSDHTKRIPLNDIPGAPSKQSTLPSSSGKGGARSRSRSRATKTFDQPKTTATVDLPYLGSCDPHVERFSYEAVRKKYGPLPKPAADLFSALTRLPNAVIPGTLKVSLLFISQIVRTDIVLATLPQRPPNPDRRS